MSSFVQTIQNIFRIEELRKRMITTLLILVVVRVGAHITLPGIDIGVLQTTMGSDEGTLFGLFDLFVGGAWSNAAIFALGVMPYITASIILQLGGIVVPELQRLQREGEEGRRKINQWTRMLTVGISALQAYGTTVRHLNTVTTGAPLVPVDPVLFTISTVFLLTAGTVFMMWLGEQITDRGIGNGISLIIFIGIIARLPESVFQEYKLIEVGQRNWIVELIILVILVAIIAGVVLVTQGARRIPVQYARRQVGRKVYGGTTQYIPLRVNTAGVMPIIFAQSLMFVPNTVLSFFPESEFLSTLARLFSYESFVYAGIYGLMIVFFTYFYTAIVFNPKDIADNMKKQGGFIPGIRPGKPTSEYIDQILTRITLPGSIFLAIVAILPTFVTNIFAVTSNFASFFGGTSLLIIIGVALDTLQQIESYLLMRHYDGFMKSGKIKGRVGQGGF
ncbi:MAG: preprotein translocase subunit SecY [Ignavibacteria bacterium GWB2_35_12]|nr:MAG: preprotein translocase subunit SecY [Ignavibacteria bacterium GWA2_35_8]OGU39778.1 MAG: preprotein translocase subunit SecY [Ignavibacteria bacterium GWB2_35_12]OGU95549.1 MAG: preprotein translocase subunit SecY [Ignavibacteria bacterium RIFOXYA2_FULL_35_10]OGV21331.1 MAG: preprotein translocase subunit SecY [Ignavibacteria bacterium RIFOXYC2_FULL_35_21]